MLTATPTTPWYRERWPWLLAIMPTTAVIAGFTTLWLAIKSDDGLVTDDYYKAGLAINKIIERDEVAQRLKIGAVIRFEGSSVSLKLSGNLSQLPDSLHLTLNHPTRSGLDLSLLLLRDANGTYLGKTQGLLNTRYDAIVEPLDGEWRMTAQWHPKDGPDLKMGNAGSAGR